VSENAADQLFLGRQPILDRNQQLFAYELLFRSGSRNYADITCGVQATATVIANAFTELGVEAALGEYRGFINVDEAFLFSDLLELLPRHAVVLEILETVPPTPAVIERCVIQRTTDDAFNNHGYWKHAVAVAEHSITFREGLPKSLAAGQVAEAFETRTDAYLARLTVESVEGKTVRFREPVGAKFATAAASVPAEVVDQKALVVSHDPVPPVPAFRPLAASQYRFAAFACGAVDTPTPRSAAATMREARDKAPRGRCRRGSDIYCVSLLTKGAL